MSHFRLPRTRQEYAGASPAKGCQDGWALEHTACEERLREWGLSSTKKRKQREARRQSCCLKLSSVK